MRSPRPLERISLIFAASWLLSCSHGDPAPRNTEPAQRPLAATERARPEHAVASSSAPEAALVEVAADTPSPRGDMGVWADSSSYRFRVSGNKRCAGDLLALSVDVFAKYDELLVAGRDVKLESAGIILDGEIHPKVGARCGALLRPQQLKQGQTASGVVLFAVPPEFDTRSVVVSYKATRWGGAPRLEVALPASTFSVAQKL